MIYMQEFAVEVCNAAWNNIPSWCDKPTSSEIFQEVMIGYRRCGISVLLAYSQLDTVDTVSKEKKASALMLTRMFSMVFFGNIIHSQDELVAKFSALKREEYAEKEQLFLLVMDFALVFLVFIEAKKGGNRDGNI